MLLYSTYRNIFSDIIHVIVSSFPSHVFFTESEGYHSLVVEGKCAVMKIVEQEATVVNMVAADNAIRLRKVRAAVIADQGIFWSINNVSLTTTDRILRRNHMAMKQLYRVPFQKNSDVVCGGKETLKYCDDLSYHAVSQLESLFIVILPFFSLREQKSLKLRGHIMSSFMLLKPT